MDSFQAIGLEALECIAGDLSAQRRCEQRYDNEP
jgi:hypothetical protein